jgi:hypothetical protein
MSKTSASLQACTFGCGKPLQGAALSCKIEKEYFYGSKKSINLLKA